MIISEVAAFKNLRWYGRLPNVADRAFANSYPHASMVRDAPVEDVPGVFIYVGSPRRYWHDMWRCAHEHSVYPRACLSDRGVVGRRRLLDFY